MKTPFFVELQLEAGEGAEKGEEGASSVISSDLLPPAPSSSVQRRTLEKFLNSHLFNIQGARPKIKKLRKNVTKIVQVSDTH